MCCGARRRCWSLWTCRPPQRAGPRTRLCQSTPTTNTSGLLKSIEHGCCVLSRVGRFQQLYMRLAKRYVVAKLPASLSSSSSSTQGIDNIGTAGRSEEVYPVLFCSAAGMELQTWVDSLMSDSRVCKSDEFVAFCTSAPSSSTASKAPERKEG